MRKFLIGLLTILLTFAFLVLGISWNLKAVITENIEGILKEEITTEIVSEVAKNTNINKENVKKELTKVMEENVGLKNAIDDSFDKVMDILSGKEVNEINLSHELENVIYNSEEVLKSYGITVTKEEKEKLLDIVNSEEFNKDFQNTVKEVQENLPNNTKVAIDAFLFLRSTTFKCILVGSIIVILVFIAILKKSYYKWLGNLSEATFISGILFGILMPWVVNLINQELVGSNRFVLSMNSISQYGYILLGIGIFSLVLKVVFAKILDKKEISSAQNE